MKKIELSYNVRIPLIFAFIVLAAIGITFLAAEHLNKRRTVGIRRSYELVYEIDGKPVVVEISGYSKNSSTKIDITDIHIPVAPSPTYVFTREDFMSIKSIRERWFGLYCLLFTYLAGLLHPILSIGIVKSTMVTGIFCLAYFGR